MKHSGRKIKDGGARRAGDALRSAGFGPALDKARTHTKQKILDDYRSGSRSKKSATDEIRRLNLRDA